MREYLPFLFVLGPILFFEAMVVVVKALNAIDQTDRSHD